MPRALFLAIFILWVSNAESQTVFHSLSEVWSAAIKNNPNQHIYRLRTSQLTYEYRAAQSYLYPQISGAFSGTDNLKLNVTPVPGELIGQPGKTLYLTFGKHYVYNGGVIATENLFDWQYVFHSNIARENITLNNLQQEAYQQSLKASAAQYYFSSLVAAASLRIADFDLRVADSILSAIGSRYAQGLVDIAAVHSAEINVNNVKQNIIQSSQLYTLSIQNLKILTGLTARETLSLDERLDIDTLSADTSSALFPGPDKSLSVYAANVRLAELEAKSEKAAAYPTLSISGFAGSQQFRDNFGLGFNNGDWNNYRYIQLNLGVPLFTGFYNRNKYRSAETLARINAEQYRTAVEQGKINDSLLVTTYDNYRLLAAASARNLVLYRENVELSRQKFAEGMISVDSFQETFEEYLRAENAHLNNLSSLFSAMSSIISRNSN
ncbi:MAG TPA: TolC family protein [Puia sp.]|nr:TolC family protein [Puia sp.]